MQLNSAKKERDTLKNKPTSCLNKLSHLSTCNVNKKLKTQKDNVQVLKEKLFNQEGKIGELEVETKELNKKLEEALKASMKERKKRDYWKNLAKKNASKNDNSSFSQSSVDELNEQIMYLQNEKLQLEERMQDFVANKVNFFHNGKYDDNICTVYQDLLCMGVSTRNVKNVIEIALRDLLGIEVTQLPKPTFANYMLWEARYVAQIHVTDELTNAVENSTLYSDGTSKKGHSYATFDYQKPDGTIIVTGLRCAGGGDTQTQLDTFKEILSEISESSGNTDSSFISQTFFSIKNLMSDRCATQKKINNFFQEYRSSVTPDVIDKWNTLKDVEQKNFNSLNDFFCGLHCLVGLADQAEASIKLWEGLLIGDAKVGSLNHGSYSKGESGTLCLIHTVCKSVSERGCEKSGRMVTFATFL